MRYFMLLLLPLALGCGASSTSDVSDDGDAGTGLGGQGGAPDGGTGGTGPSGGSAPATGGSAPAGGGDTGGAPATGGSGTGGADDTNKRVGPWLLGGLFYIGKTEPGASVPEIECDPFAANTVNCGVDTPYGYRCTYWETGEGAYLDAIEGCVTVSDLSLTPPPPPSAGWCCPDLRN